MDLVLLDTDVFSAMSAYPGRPNPFPPFFSRDLFPPDEPE